MTPTATSTGSTSTCSCSLVRSRGPLRLGELHDRGALVTGWRDTARVAFQPLSNLVGRPAVMLPAGHDRDGLPASVRLGSRPGDLPRLLALAAPLERARGVAPVPPLATAVGPAAALAALTGG